MKREISFYLIIISISWIFCSGTFGFGSIDNFDSIKRYLPPEAIMVNKDIIQSSGFDPNNIEDIKLAAMEDNEYVTKGDSYILREAAISLLVYKARKESIPVLKTSLNDSHPYIRYTATRFLIMLGDKSGLEIMRKDLKELTKDDEEYEKIYNESYGKKKAMLKSFRTKNRRLLFALEAALVLAENGDMSGYKLAAQKAIEDKNILRRRTAIRVLMALTFINKETLEKKGVFPEVIILDVAKKETDSFIIHHLIGYAQKISQSERFSDELREKAEKAIEELSKRIEKENEDTKK